MKNFFKNVLSTVVGIILSVFIVIIIFFGIISLSISSINNENNKKIKENSILTLNLSETIIAERTKNNPLQDLNISGDIKKTIELYDVLNNIEKAKEDENIKAIYINSNTINAGLSQIEEIRNKLLEFKKTGKKIIAYADYYSQSAYYLSSIANKIYLNPEGAIELKGLAISQMFFKDMLEKLDIEIQIIRHGKFKSAIEPFTLNEMSFENKQQMEQILNSYIENIFDSIANQRGMNLSEIESHANQLQLNSAKKCVDLAYVDKLLYQDEVEYQLSLLLDSNKINFVDITKYTNVKTTNKKISRNKIAIIYATGSINTGKGDEENIGSKTTSKAIKDAREDKNVKAIVFRINSGGGSALASEVIWRETMLAKKTKPFIVSMGDYAASGGYYIACAADTIIANPTTLTGSIGVFGMVPNLENFYRNKLGISIDVAKTNTYADIGINRSLSQYEKNQIQNSIKNIYNTFIERVANGRKMNREAVDEISQGRVWSGYDAKKIGLVDIYGGLDKAIKIAAYKAKIKDYRITSLPKKKDPINELIMEIGKNNNSNFSFSNSLNNNLINNYIKDLEKLEKIQARIPYFINLK
ncbi:MAG: signal peptide peptidase SppA [Flavobacteriales bacterium]|nr:signal peptide peptidase SppA [Flavobacteriales bacterium]